MPYAIQHAVAMTSSAPVQADEWQMVAFIATVVAIAAVCSPPSPPIIVFRVTALLTLMIYAFHAGAWPVGCTLLAVSCKIHSLSRRIAQPRFSVKSDRLIRMFGEGPPPAEVWN